jgi:hypothetical protein
MKLALIFDTLDSPERSISSRAEFVEEIFQHSEAAAGSGFRQLNIGNRPRVISKTT